MTSPEPEEEMEETLVITMVDEEGGEQDFALLDMIEVDGRHYGLFAPADELDEDEDEEADEQDAAEDDGEAENDEDDEEGEGILVLRAVQRGSEQDFEMIEDEAEFTRVLDHLDKMAAAAQANFGTSVNNN